MFEPLPNGAYMVMIKNDYAAAMSGARLNAILGCPIV